MLFLLYRSHWFFLREYDELIFRRPMLLVLIFISVRGHNANQNTNIINSYSITRGRSHIVLAPLYYSSQFNSTCRTAVKPVLCICMKI